MGYTEYSVQRGVAVITMDNPPVNGLGHDLRVGLMDGLKRASGDAAVKAVVIIGTTKAFSGGADISEFNTPKATAEPTLHQIIDMLDGMKKPVVAGIGGFAMPTPSFCPITRRSSCFPLNANEEVRPVTFKSGFFARTLSNSSVKPSEKYSFSGSGLMFANGSTAMAGRLFADASIDAVLSELKVRSVASRSADNSAAVWWRSETSLARTLSIKLCSPEGTSDL